MNRKFKHRTKTESKVKSTPAFQYRPEDVSLKILIDVLESGFALDKTIHFWFKKLKISDLKFRSEVYQTVTRVCYHHGYLLKKVDSEDLTGPRLFRKEIKQLSQLTDLELASDEFVKYSFPEWFVKKLYECYDFKAAQILKSLLEVPLIYLRANTINSSINNVAEMLGTEKYSLNLKLLEEGILCLKNNVGLFATDAYKLGLFEVQDISSQQVALIVDAKPGERVADACAGAGGKTLQLAMQMQNKGKLLALDINEGRLVELKKRAAKAGMQNIETKLVDNAKSLKRFENSFDAVLIDAPCSGTGVFKRNPDAKWNFKFESLGQLIIEQRQVLTTYSNLTKSGGRMIFSTCSLLQEEGEEQTKWFLENNLGWSLTEQKRIFPADLNGDGFYIASFRKK